MATHEMNDLLEMAAPAPDRALDIGHIEDRAHRRRRRRHVSVTGASLLVVGSLIGLALQFSGSPEPDRVIAGPLPAPTIAVERHDGTATAEIGLLDGTRLRLTLPEELGRMLAGKPLADLRWNGMVYAEPVTRAPRSWGIEVIRGPIEKLAPGEPLAVPPSSRADAASISRRPDRLGLQPDRLGMQFGPWTVVASGYYLTENDIQTLLTDVLFVETANGFPEYRGSLPLWPVDSPDAAVVDGGGQGVSVFIQPRPCLPGAFQTKQHTVIGLEFLQVEGSSDDLALTEFCDETKALRISAQGARHLTKDELDQVRIETLSVGPVLAAVQRGATPLSQSEDRPS